ncbi:MAG: hypothetical protein OEX02_19750 [Cyclobacteriaceae bacterium]|nr:hypothetical protein [Cyclobacteriaceae bacterium]
MLVKVPAKRIETPFPYMHGILPAISFMFIVGVMLFQVYILIRSRQVRLAVEG